MADPHRPVAHLRPPANWINDPNGLVVHDGWVHVFAQHNPGGVHHADMHWAHARSRDLLTWEWLPIALAPTPGGDDRDGVWSGNAVSHDGVLHAFSCAKRDDRWWQPVAVATSSDGVRLAKEPGLLIAEPPARTTMFRDPYVWRDGGRWRMLVGAGLDDGRGAAHHYESADLRAWRHTGLFHASAPLPLPGGGDTEEGWECPQWVPPSSDGGPGALIVSTWDAVTGPSATAVFVGAEDALADVAPDRFDHGPDLYAPAVMAHPDGRWLAWGWLPEARDAAAVEAAGWAGVLSLPRELGLDGDRLTQRPARELDALLGPEVDPDDVPRAFDAEVTLAPGAVLRLVTSPEGAEHVDLRHELEGGAVVIDRGLASLDPAAACGSCRLPTRLPAGEDVRLRVVVDHSVVEVYTAAGDVATLRFYPGGAGPWRLEVDGAGVVRVRALGALTVR